MHRSLTLAIGCIALAGSFATACSDNGGSSGNFCTLAKAYDAQNKSFGDAFASGDKDNMKKALNSFGSQIDGMAKAAPAELKSDLSLLKSTANAFIDVVAKADYDLTAVQNDPTAEAVVAKFDSDEVNAASDNVDKYLEQTCGIKSGS